MSSQYPFACQPHPRAASKFGRHHVRRSALLLAAASLPLGAAVPAHAMSPALAHAPMTFAPSIATAVSLAPATPAATPPAATPAPAFLPMAPSAVTRYVDVSMANVRSGPGLSNRVVKQLRRGTKVTGTKTSNGWIKIRSGQYISGSILSTRSSSRSSSSSSSNTVTRYVNVSSGNVRSGSSTSYRVVKSLRRGTKVTGTKTSNGWIKIRSGQYISGSILSTRSSSGSSRSGARSVTRYITASMGNVRSGSSTSHRVVTTLSRGSKVEGSVQSNGWLRIGSGRYVSASILSSSPSRASRTSSRSTVTRYVTASSGNVRTGAGSSYQVVQTLRRDTKVTGTLTSNGWLRIGSGRYISGNILRGGSSGASASGSAVINEARKYLGIMYVYGGTSPSGFDCSGYTQYVYRKLGVVLPRVVSQQRAATTAVSSPKVGDLVFWGTRHVAIYAGDGYIYDSGRTGLPVQKRKMFSGVTGYGRVG